MTPLERWAVNISTLIVAISGILYAIMKYLVTSQDPFAVINHPLQPWMLDLHVLGAPVMIFAVGWIASVHIADQFRKGVRRPGGFTGVFAVICILPMVSTGYLIQVFTQETARLTLIIVHLITGGLYMITFVAHLIVSRRLAARKKNGAVTQGPGARGWKRQPWVARTRRRPARSLS